MSPAPALPRLHVLTDQRAPEDTVRLAELVLAAGAPCIQLRAKGLDDRTWYQLAADVADRCRAAGAICIVNDRTDIARAAGADGVHVGEDDLPVAAARRAAGADLIVGATARTPEGARRAIDDGADYLGVGPVFSTSTKAGLPDPIGLSGLEAVTRTATVPVIGISGVTAENAARVLEAGAHGIAVVSAVTAAADPAAATRALLDRLERAKQSDRP